MVVGRLRPIREGQHAMSIDTAAPRTRRAIIAGAFGALLGTIGVTTRPEPVRAGTDGDVVLDATNTAAGTTVLNGNGSNPVLRVANADEDAIQGVSENGVGILGGSGDTSFPGPIEPSTGVFGISVDGHGVYAASDSNAGLYAANNATDVAAIVAEGDPGTAIHGHGGPGPVPSSPAATAIFASAVDDGNGISSWVENGIALQALSTESIAILASGEADGIAGASSGNRTGVVGWSTDKAVGVPAVPAAGPAMTGVYGEATQDEEARGVFGKTTIGQGVRGEASQGVGVAGEAPGGTGVEGRGSIGVVGVTGNSTVPSAPVSPGVQGFGTIGVYGSSNASVGVFGKSGTGSPGTPDKTGVYGYAAQDASARGVLGQSMEGNGVRGAATTGQGVHGEATSGQGIHGEATTGVGVKAVASSGVALDVDGPAVFSRSGRASVPAGAQRVDVTVPGGLDSNANVLATLQIRRGKVHVVAARPNYPSSGKVRIYLSDVASTTAATPLAWFVLG
jgi:hypothetical protein